MILQSHADDSGSEQTSHTFVLGGWVAPVASWLDFDLEWQAALDGPPKLDYFKMTEAMHLRGQFSRDKGWTDAKVAVKVDQLIDIILKYVTCSMHVSVRNDEYARHLKSVPLPSRALATDSPYLMLLTQYVLNAANIQKEFGGTEPVQFIFDLQTGHSDEAIMFWPILKQIARDNGLGHLLNNPPTFENDKDFLPLQAADLFAWEQRIHLENNKKLIVPFGKRLARLKSKMSVGSQFTEETLRALNRRASGLVKEHLEHHPFALLKKAGKKNRKGMVPSKKDGKP